MTENVQENLNKVYANSLSTGNVKWFIDSGATSHMCCNEDSFTYLDKSYSGKVRLADENPIVIKGKGTVKLMVVVNNKETEI